MLGGSILNLTTYSNSFDSSVDRAVHNAMGNDMTYALLYTSEGKHARGCLLARYSTGIATRELSGCIADNIIMNVMFAAILAIIIVRYSMALLFQWVIARQLTKPGGRSNWLAWRSIRGGNEDPVNHPDTLDQIQTDIVSTELYTVMLVTCYSEGEEGNE
ncbi:hypothetical protein G6F56_012795 [Rhizopus delemar]|nr:hypothetical protein G6F56_012795 [Rhizopus delemar]